LFRLFFEVVLEFLKKSQNIFIGQGRSQIMENFPSPPTKKSGKILWPHPIDSVNIDEIERKGSESPTEEMIPPVWMDNEERAWSRKYLSFEIGQQISFVSRHRATFKGGNWIDTGTVVKMKPFYWFEIDIGENWDWDDMGVVLYMFDEFWTDVFTRHIPPTLTTKAKLQSLSRKTFRLARDKKIFQYLKCGTPNCKDLRLGHLVNFFH